MGFIRMNRLVRFLMILSLPYCLSTAFAQTESMPQWEVGAGIAAINTPLYRGAQERRSYLLPIPYFIYRGDTLQVNRERVRGLIFRRGSVEMDFSVNGSLPAKSSDTVARQGMSDLDWALEIGPSLNVHLYYSANQKTNLDLRLPLRSVTATDFMHTQNIGWLLQPQLALDLYGIRHSAWKIGIIGGLILTDQRYQQYFYDVAPQYATATRPAYTANGGYSGSQLSLTVNKRENGRRIGGFIKWENLESASFADSPLVKNKQYFTLGFVVLWALDKSAKMTEMNND